MPDALALVDRAGATLSVVDAVVVVAVVVVVVVVVVAAVGAIGESQPLTLRLVAGHDRVGRRHYTPGRRCTLA